MLDFRTPCTRTKWDTVSPLKGSPARRLFSWTIDGQLGVSSVPVVDDDWSTTVMEGELKALEVLDNEDACGPDDKKTNNLLSLELPSFQEEHSSGPDTISVCVQVGCFLSNETTNEDVFLDISEDHNVHMSPQ